MNRKIYESIKEHGYYADRTQVVVPIPVVLVSDDSEALLLQGESLADARLAQTRLVSEITSNLKEFFEEYGSLADIAELLEELDDFFDELEEDLECECNCKDEDHDDNNDDEDDFELLDDEDEFSIETLDGDEEDELEDLIDDVLDDIDNDFEEVTDDDLDNDLDDDVNLDDDDDDDDNEEDDDKEDEDDHKVKTVSEKTQTENHDVADKVEKVTKDMDKDLSSLIKQIRWQMESNEVNEGENIAENDFNLVGEAKKTSLQDLVDEMLEDIIDPDIKTKSNIETQESYYVKSLFEELSKKL